MKKLTLALFCSVLCCTHANAGIIKGIKSVIRGTGHAISAALPGGGYRPMYYGGYPNGYGTYGASYGGTYAPMLPGTGTTWGCPQPMLSQPVFINGQAGLLNTLPGGGYSYFGAVR